MKTLISKLKFFQILIVLVAFSCSEFDPDTSTSSTISTLSSTDVLAANGYTVLVDAIEAAGLTSTIDASSDITIFAPNNIAFSNLLDELGVASISEVDQATLASLLSYHVVTSNLASDALTSSMATLEGSNIFLADGALNGKVNIIATDLVSATGRVHGIDAVLTIPSATIVSHLNADDNYDLIAYAIETAGLNATLSGATEYTVLAPNDDAFRAAGLDSTGIEGSTAEALSDILLFHVIAGRVYSTGLPASGSYVVTAAGGEADGVQEVLVGDGPRFNGESVTTANISTGNGVIHNISDVLGSYNTMSTVRSFAGVIDNVIYGGAAVYGPTFALIAELDYTPLFDIQNRYNLYVEFNGPSSSADARLGDVATATTYLENRIFDSNLDINGLANGTRITSINGSNYFIAATEGGTEYVNGTTRNVDGSTGGLDFFSTPAYKGTNAYSYSGAFEPLPTTNLLETLLAVDSLDLFGKALEVTGLGATVSSGDHTIFAVEDATFAAFSGYATIADLDTLSEGEEDDQDVIDDLIEVLNYHIIPNSVQFEVVIGTDRPSLTTLDGAALQVTTVYDAAGDAQVGFVGDPSDITGTQYVIINTDGTASNGVIHVLDSVIPEVVE